MEVNYIYKIHTTDYATHFKINIIFSYKPTNIFILVNKLCHASN